MVDLIAFVGAKLSGKDTTLDICNGFGLGGKKLGLADHLKDVCSAVFNMDRDIFDDQGRKEVPMKRPIILRRDMLYLVALAYQRVLGTLDMEVFKLSAELHAGTLIYTPRHLLQYIGTDYLRESYPEIHLDVAAEKRDPEALSVITDCRFANEVAWAKQRGGITIYIYRPEADQRALESEHLSESGIPALRQKCDYVIENTGTLEELHVLVQQALPLILGDTHDKAGSS